MPTDTATIWQRNEVPMNTFPYLISPLRELPATSLMGEVVVPGPNKHFKRTPNDWIVYIISDGTMKLHEDNRQYLLSAGDILILSPGRCHFGLPVNDSIHYFYIHFRWDTLKELLLTQEEYRDKKIEMQEKVFTCLDQQPDYDHLLLPKYFHPSQTVFEDILTDIQHLLQNAERALPHQQSINNCLFFQLLLKLSRSEIYRSLPGASNAVSSVLPIITYLKENHKNKISSLTLEKEFHRNFDYMNRKFKETTGTTIFAFLEKYRIEESKKWLESKRFSITEIAEMLGFCNAFYFSKVFKKHENITPSEYKNRH